MNGFRDIYDFLLSFRNFRKHMKASGNLRIKQFFKTPKFKNLLKNALDAPFFEITISFVNDRKYPETSETKTD